MTLEDRAKKEAALSPVLAREATQECIEHAKEIDETLPECFRSNPGGEALSPKRKARLQAILARRKQLMSSIVEQSDPKETVAT